MNKTEFHSSLAEKGIVLNETQMQQFELYFRELVEWNNKMNLTAITDEEAVYLKHFYDSISAAFFHDFTKPLRLVDVGAGAGFPSIPIKICFPHLNVTIVDSLNKRISFLQHLASMLKLEKVAFFHDRAESFAKKKEHRENYDFVIARAVARMPVLAELCLPLVKVGGLFLAMKGPEVVNEIADSKKAIATLGGHVVRNESLLLPVEESTRHFVFIEKRKKTPNTYPRKPGTPNKQPL
ncbi:16S rRNA (guanine(527)-N(7))-methyltransferase RsmG [Anaerobacillus isosaccharinicus]|uniref:Ribosomal RNA small subunit methyltransferase G n=1 Tax=Anaerobacillus isosaccharinicus TaxID=1532552 RepID=A0A1S2MHN9_9BACI|nr:16S rRNA (guanine(527)-N(7))-methyltransferase RsmG [Anaerobacillus isosaccharinicus]MBA5584216.1 16S rRNA (guanine(527)-N(7))-methyltransferase RsmG [Anaerobacillus isosaccharinicus]QOY37382.1 16S rRNA (guanine(527)-N(7))-methyltransferase RsmG [Anaerobacillus isosaccharinicus]